MRYEWDEYDENDNVIDGNGITLTHQVNVEILVFVWSSSNPRQDGRSLLHNSASRNDDPPSSGRSLVCMLIFPDSSRAFASNSTIGLKAFSIILEISLYKNT